MKVELKNVKIAEFLSEETTAFTATLYIDGKRTGMVRNDGRGGNNHVTPWAGVGWEPIRAFQSWAATLPPLVIDDLGELPMNDDLYISELLSKHQEEKEIRGWCRTKIVLKHKDSEPDAFEAIKSKYHPANLEALQALYPDYEIVNARFS